jgi:hypothetical protein
MAGPIELIIVAGAFSLVGLFLFVASRFIHAAEQGTPETTDKHA